MWYISSTKPKFGHIKAQLKQDCLVIQCTVAKEFCQACNKTVDFTQMPEQLAKMAINECNKLNNMPFKIMTEMKKAEAMHEKLKSLHDVCLRVTAAMSKSQSGMATKYDLAQDMAKLNSRIDSMSDHLQQLLHPIKNAVKSIQ